MVMEQMLEGAVALFLCHESLMNGTYDKELPQGEGIPEEGPLALGQGILSINFYFDELQRNYKKSFPIGLVRCF